MMSGSRGTPASHERLPGLDMRRDLQAIHRWAVVAWDSKAVSELLTLLHLRRVWTAGQFVAC